MAAKTSEPASWGFDVEKKKQDEREKLRQYFLTLKPDQQKNGWDDMWRKGVTPWDHAQPNPALVDALKEKSHLSGSPFKGEDKKERRKALVPGCGKGYDALLFSSYGFDAYGLDGSPKAIEEAQKLYREQDKEQQYPVQNIHNGRGDVTFVAGDFFSDDFLAGTHSNSSDGTFDLIYDYTFLCALPPSLRPRWAKRMSELLSPNGRLICMEYPLGKDPKLGGPPHGLEHELYEQLFAKPGAEVSYNESGHVCENRSGEKATNALVKIEEWRPERAFEGQRQSLMVSIWRRANA